MLLTNKIRQLKKENQLLQCQLAPSLVIDKPIYSKIEHLYQIAKYSQVISFGHFLYRRNRNVYTWLADNITEVFIR